MHGIIFSELRRYADDRLGPYSWRALLREVGLGPRIYLPVQAYPDAEAIALIGAAAARAGLPVPVVLEDFGTFIAPTLLSMYRSLIEPGWRTLDVLENTEQTIHTVVRMRNPGAVPAVLSCRRHSSDYLVLTYTSERRLCPLAIGIIKGLAAHFGDGIDIDQTQCMYDGADACTMAVRTKASARVPTG
jgi:hypothetical protein